MVNALDIIRDPEKATKGIEPYLVFGAPDTDKLTQAINILAKRGWRCLSASYATGVYVALMERR